METREQQMETLRFRIEKLHEQLHRTESLRGDFPPEDYELVVSNLEKRIADAEEALAELESLGDLEGERGEALEIWEEAKLKHQKGELSDEELKGYRERFKDYQFSAEGFDWPMVAVCCALGFGAGWWMARRL